MSLEDLVENKRWRTLTIRNFRCPFENKGGHRWPPRDTIKSFRRTEVQQKIRWCVPSVSSCLFAFKKVVLKRKTFYSTTAGHLDVINLTQVIEVPFKRAVCKYRYQPRIRPQADFPRHATRLSKSRTYPARAPPTTTFRRPLCSSATSASEEEV
jgi:hypothetical protein